MFVCTYCNIQCSTSSSLNRHALNVHKIQVSSPKRECDECCEKFFSDKQLILHHTRKHTFRPVYRQYQFPTLAAFKTWKQKVEKEAGIRYIVTTSARKGNREGKTKAYLSCHRSGKHTPRGTRKHPPSLKCGRRCFAAMTVTSSSAGVNVLFQSKHRGHELELPYSQSETKIETAMLQEVMSLGAVLDDVGLNVEVTAQCQDTVDDDKHLHVDDHASVQLWVERMHLRRDNPVLFFKNRGQPDRPNVLDRLPDNLLKEKDFMLAMMTAPQQELLRTLGTNRVCVDSTRGTTGKHFKFTLISS
ncbi:hypothetical protein MTO96_044700 [Rhipicephalus appendiculatus]